MSIKNALQLPCITPNLIVLFKLFFPRKYLVLFNYPQHSSRKLNGKHFSLNETLRSFCVPGYYIIKFKLFICSLCCFQEWCRADGYCFQVTLIGIGSVSLCLNWIKLKNVFIVCMVANWILFLQFRKINFLWMMWYVDDLGKVSVFWWFLALGKVLWFN